MVLAIRWSDDDRAIHLARREAQISQRVKRQEFESVTVIATASERLFESGPVIDGPILAIMLFGL